MSISQEYPKILAMDGVSTQRPEDTGRLLEQLLGAFQALEAELEAQRLENIALVRRLAEREDVAERQQQSAQLSLENAALTDLVAQGHAQMRALEQRERDLRRVLSEQEIEIHRLSARLEQAESELRCLETATCLVESELVERDETCRQMEAELVARERELRQLRYALQRAHGED